MNVGCISPRRILNSKREQTSKNPKISVKKSAVQSPRFRLRTGAAALTLAGRLFLCGGRVALSAPIWGMSYGDQKWVCEELLFFLWGDNWCVGILQHQFGIWQEFRAKSHRLWGMVGICNQLDMMCWFVLHEAKRKKMFLAGKLMLNQQMCGYPIFSPARFRMCFRTYYTLFPQTV